MRAALVGVVVAAAAFALIAVVGGIEGGEVDGGGRAASAPAAEPAPARAEIAQGRELFARMACGSCHTLATAGSHGQIGPDLAAIGERTRASLVATITNPSSDGGFTAMPTDFGSRMTAEELNALAAFLIAARDG
jgi:mono/diheme cytochrome c family protein